MVKKIKKILGKLRAICCVIKDICKILRAICFEKPLDPEDLRAVILRCAYYVGAYLLQWSFGLISEEGEGS